MIFGMIGLLLSCILIGIIPCVIGVVLGFIVLKQGKSGRGMAITGIVTSGIGIVIFILMMIALIKTALDESVNATSVRQETAIAETITTETTLADVTIIEAKEELNKETEIEKEVETEPVTRRIEVETEAKSVTEAELQGNKFLSVLSTVLDSVVAEKSYDILKNQIGFSELEYERQPVTGMANYEIYADGYLIMLTASDDVYRIFIPNGNTVFYENGEVKTTASEFSDKLIDQYDATSYYIIAKEIVKNNLKSPKGASFPGQNEILFQKKGNLVAVKGYVDAKNSFNAKVRGEWIVEFEVIDLQSFSYNTVFINIDGTKAGEFIPLD